jgi:transcriptional regulator with XRE-family HTH domain
VTQFRHASSWPALGRRLHEARCAAGLSQRTVGRAIGLTQVAYWSFEHGYSRPREAHLETIATVLKIELAELRQLAGYGGAGAGHALTGRGDG